MHDSIEYDKVNEAIVRFVAHDWTKALEQQITQSYGPELAAQVKFIHNEAMSCPVDWRQANMDSALAVLADFLATRFPQLSPEAKTCLNYAYIMTWK